MSKPIFLMGPTAIGKTDLVISLSQKYPIDIISVDSAMVYKGMNIGSGKPSPAQLMLAPHALVDICEINETFSAAHFVKQARQLIDRSLAQNRVPVVVGGTMMYFKALKEGLSNLPSSTPETRAKWIKAWDENPKSCYEKLCLVDPDCAEKLPAGDKQRIIRALEVYSLTGQPISKQQHNRQNAWDKPSVWVSMMPADRSWLKERIKLRFDKMLEDGFIEEVEKLTKHPHFSYDLPSMQAVGYKQVLRFFSKEYTFAEMQEKSVVVTCQLAKRQLTWLRSWQDCYELEWGKESTFQDFECFLSKFLV